VADTASWHPEPGAWKRRWPRRTDRRYQKRFVAPATGTIASLHEERGGDGERARNVIAEQGLGEVAPGMDSPVSWPIRIALRTSGPPAIPMPVGREAQEVHAAHSGPGRHISGDYGRHASCP